MFWEVGMVMEVWWWLGCEVKAEIKVFLLCIKEARCSLGLFQSDCETRYMFNYFGGGPHVVKRDIIFGASGGERMEKSYVSMAAVTGSAPIRFRLALTVQRRSLVSLAPREYCSELSLQHLSLTAVNAHALLSAAVST